MNYWGYELVGLLLISFFIPHLVFLFFGTLSGLFKGGKKKRKKTLSNIFFSLFRLKKGNVTVHLRVQCSHRYGAAQPQFTGSSKDCSVTFSFSPSRCRNSRGTADHDVGRTSRDPNQQLGGGTSRYYFLSLLFLSFFSFFFFSSLLPSWYQELTKVRDRLVLRQGFSSSKKNKSNNPNLSFTETSH